MGRATQGVRIMRLNSGDVVASTALVVEPDGEIEDKGGEKKPAKK
jgi:hypothetical protein